MCRPKFEGCEGHVGMHNGEVGSVMWRSCASSVDLRSVPNTKSMVVLSVSEVKHVLSGTSNEDAPGYN